MTLRRDFLGFTAGAVAARTVLPAVARAESAHPDAGLIADSIEYYALQKAGAALPNEAEDAIYAVWDRAHEVFARVVRTKPKTLIGLKAKARVVIEGFHEGVVASVGGTMEQEGEWHELAAWQLMQDVLLLGSEVA